jgi:excisionase family DNA binding protein
MSDLRNQETLAVFTTTSWNGQNLLTVAEVAEWARVHPKTVYRWIKEGKLASIQFGPRTFRIPEDAVRTFLLRADRAQSSPMPKPNGREP